MFVSIFASHLLLGDVSTQWEKFSKMTSFLQVDCSCNISELWCHTSLQQNFPKRSKSNLRGGVSWTRLEKKPLLAEEIKDIMNMNCFYVKIPLSLSSFVENQCLSALKKFNSSSYFCFVSVFLCWMSFQRAHCANIQMKPPCSDQWVPGPLSK